MIRTRPQSELGIVGNGEFIVALDKAELQLISALAVMCRLGSGTYEEAAVRILDKIEDVTGEIDFGLEALVDISPSFSIRDPLTLDVIAEYDEDFIVEINV